MNAIQDLGITKEDILDKVAEKLISYYDGDDELYSERIVQRCEDKLLKEAGPKIDNILDKALSNIVDSNFVPVDEWGEPSQESPTTLRRMVKDKAMAYLTTKVDEKGHASSYRATRTRAEWLAKKAAESAITHEIKRELDKAVKTALDELRSQVAEHITKTLLKSK